MELVYKHDNRPWMIGFSGGKDSTLLCCLVFEMLMQLEPNEINKKVYIVSSDTMVENPIVRDYMHDMSKRIGDTGVKYKIETRIIKPEVEKTFWSCVIGLGYPTPEAPGFRWCTDKLKIRPINRFVTETIDNAGEIVMLLGVRKAESSYRARGIKSREIEGKLLIPHTDIKNAYVYNPLTEIPNERIWNYLLSGDAVTPWGSSNKYLFSLYQGENLSEEQSTLGEIDEKKVAVTGKKLDQKVYTHHSGYVGGLKTITLKKQLEKKPEEVLKHAVKGMLPKNALGRKMFSKLHVYAGPEHAHAAQKPEVLELKF